MEPFRHTVLGGHLLELGEIESWLSEQARRDGPPSTWLSGVALNEGDHKFELGTGFITILKPIPIRTVTSAFADYGGNYLSGTGWEHPTASNRVVTCYIAHESELTRSVRVRDKGLLDWLRRLGLILADKYYWKPEQASTFILTGLVPYDKAAGAHVQTLLVNGRRPRPMSIKHLELACFTAEHEGESQAGRMSEWNALHAQWRYGDVLSFGRDSRDALKRLEERYGTGLERGEVTMTIGDSLAPDSPRHEGRGDSDQ